MKPIIKINRSSLICLVVLAWLMSACRTTTEPRETVVPTPSSATDLPPVSTSTPTEPPLAEPSHTPATETPELTTGQVTPGGTPTGTEALVGWVMTDTAILRTVDGGVSWEDVTPPGIQEILSSGSGSPGIAAAFSGGDFALVAYPQGERIGVYRTSNGGQNWEEGMLELREAVQGITAIEMVGEEHGWLLATRGVGAGNDWVDLYDTQDGGASWSFLAGSDSETNPAGGISSGGLKSGLSFSSPENGWLTGSAPIDMVYLFRTQDGGLTWQSNHLPLPEGASFSSSSYPPIFFDEQNGMLPVTLVTLSNEPGLLFYKTQDAGESWVPTVLLEGNLTAWDWVDPQHGFAAGTDDQLQSKLYVTRDGGESWEAYPVEMAAVRSVDFISQQAGWAICGWAFEPREACSGDIYSTQDAGRRWERVYP